MRIGTLYAFPDRCEIVVSPDDPENVAQTEAELRERGLKPQREIRRGEGEATYLTELTVGSLAILAGPEDMSKLEEIIMGEVIVIGDVA